MCGIFGIISQKNIKTKNLNILVDHARQRGRDSSGLLYNINNKYIINRADIDIKKLISKLTIPKTKIILGHSRLITNGFKDNQPVFRDNICVLHNGIILNETEIWDKLNCKRNLQIDTEAIVGIAIDKLKKTNNLSLIVDDILNTCKGTISAAMIFSDLGKLCLFSNNGSLYLGKIDNEIYFSSEKYPLEKIGCNNIKQILNSCEIIDIPKSEIVDVFDLEVNRKNLIPTFKNISSEENLLIYKENNLRRCTKCILPETMPFIHFDEYGVCNYCKNYKLRNKPKPKEELLILLEKYKRKIGPDCIIPFSGGRDSCWALDIVVNELKLKPITYTYDWGMVTDLGRRNISRMCSSLGVENIIIADDINKKRENIYLNLKAWLNSPNLGMISILTAGDKHFFRHIETVKKQTGIGLNLWGVNPLEVTHFKAGFLGMPPDFEETKVYLNGISKQLKYQKLRFNAMLKSPRYFNSSLWDTISGEYYRSFYHKSDYYHIFDYWMWDEDECNKVLNKYDWELAPDTNTTWRIGDGTAAFYNYIYYTAAGFTEHDTFRSNQIREGQITREEALIKVKDENRPRYQNIRWYLDAIQMDFKEVIDIVNKIPFQK